MTQVNVAEAKATLSKLLEAALAGEEVVIARNGVPLVRLVALQEPASRELGFLPAATPEERFAPLPSEELERWG